MQLATQEILRKQQEQIEEINAQLRQRSEKFGSEYVPITLSDYKLYKIQKASETGKIQYLQSILFEEIVDLQERRRLIRERTQKFFPSVKVEADPNKFFNNRENPDFSEDTTKIRFNAWYLFGVDYMSNQKIRNYFTINQHFKIEWINDSSCNIVFNSKEAAEEAIKPYRKGDSMVDQKQDIWYELNQYQVEGVKRKLFCRLATTKDSKKGQTHGHDSKYYRWQLNKKHLNNFVKKKAIQYINKQKKIKKDSTVKHQTKKEEEQSSSGVDNSEQQNNEMKE